MMKQIKSTTTELAKIEPNALNIPGTTTPYPLELTESDWLGYAAKLAEAIQAKTKSINLSFAESERFAMNCELIRRVGIGNELRNYAILEVHQTKQWRAAFKTIKEFAAAYGLSKGHLYKCINEAAINIQMAQADLYSVRPRGRQVERLAKIEPKDRVEAWTFALQMADERGASSKVIDNALEEYARRLEDPNADMILIESQSSEKPAKVKNENAVCVENGGTHQCVGWIESLDLQGEQKFSQLLTLSTWYKTKGDPDQSRGRSMAYALVEAALKVPQPGTEINNTKEAVSHAIGKDRRLKRALYHLGLQLIVNHLNALYIEGHQL